MLIRCLYVSRPAGKISSVLISAILAQAAKTNPRLGITGLLCFTEDVFVQVIEGPRDAIGQLLTAIFRDPRHTAIQILVYGEIEQRGFEGWAMGQIDLDDVSDAMRRKHLGPLPLNPYELPGGTTMALIEDLARAGLTP